MSLICETQFTIGVYLISFRGFALIVKANQKIESESNNCLCHCVYKIKFNFRPSKICITVRSIGVDILAIFMATQEKAPIFTVKNSGNVGIGTRTPKTKLEIAGSNSEKHIQFDPDMGQIILSHDKGSLRLQTNEKDSGWVLQGGSDLKVGNNSSVPQFIMNKNGNVGVGTSNIIGALTINAGMTACLMSVAIQMRGKGGCPKMVLSCKE